MILVLYQPIYLCYWFICASMSLFIYDFIDLSIYDQLEKTPKRATVLVVSVVKAWRVTAGAGSKWVAKTLQGSGHKAAVQKECPKAHRRFDNQKKQRMKVRARVRSTASAGQGALKQSGLFF